MKLYQSVEFAILEQVVLRLLLIYKIYTTHYLSSKLKVTLLLSTDYIKNLYFLVKLKTLPDLVHNELYQSWDKWIDLLTYALTLKFLPYLGFDKSQISILIIALTYRSFGVGISYLTKKRDILLIFMDFFKEVLFYFYLKNNKILSNASRNVVLGLEVSLKLWTEYNFHVKKIGLASILNSILQK
jgi:hypothetical protein